MARPRLCRSVRVVFWSAVGGGATVEQASVAAGVAVSTGERWFSEAGGVKANGVSVVSGRYLSMSEREEIAVGLAAGDSARAIAGRLGRAPSTITREIERNPDFRGNYRAVLAQQNADSRARRPKTAKLAGNTRLRDRVEKWLKRRWSPEQISARLRVEFPTQPEMWVSHETIYQSIYVQGRGALRRELASCLRTGRALRKPRRPGQGSRQHIADKVLISQRPAEVADRAVPGHWEGDLIIGKAGGSAIGTLVERTTRFTMLLHLPGRHDAATVGDQVIAAMTSLPERLRRSLTWDQGIEMSHHAQITLAADIPVYFCDPHSPWQRGTNENTNGLLRQYFPKSTDLSIHTATHLTTVADELNNRPRKTLNWKTPTEALHALLSQSQQQKN